jgi:hypothetical protein
MTDTGIDPGLLLTAARLVDQFVERAEHDDALYAAAFRTGYDHGHAIGRDRGHAEAVADLEAAWARAAGGLRGRGRDELLAHGHVPRDLTRPPALPARIWDAQEWARASSRDLPTTEHGRGHWRASVAAGRVPVELARAFAELDARAVADLVSAPLEKGGEAA